MKRLLMIPVAIYATVAGSILFLGLAFSARKPFIVLRHVGGNALRLTKCLPRLCKELLQRKIRIDFGSILPNLPILIIGWPFILILVLLDDYPSE